jgi:hypothetical protein
MSKLAFYVSPAPLESHTLTIAQFITFAFFDLLDACHFAFPGFVVAQTAEYTLG